MTNAERATRIEKAIKLLRGAASAYRHGRVSTAKAKLDDAIFDLQEVAWPDPC